MRAYDTQDIRNVTLVGHKGAGKTSLAEAMLFAAGAISRLGKVDEGSSTSDYDPDEIKRKISINLSILPCHWRDNKLNFIDTPGYIDFVSETRAGLRVSEGAVIAICAASGVEVGTERVWDYCDEFRLPRVIFMNKMDRENADFARTTQHIQAKFGPKCVPVQMPVGAQSDFQGVIDLLTLKAYSGTADTEGEIPASLKPQVAALREKLVEAVAEVDDRLIEKYLGGEELTLDELRSTLRKGVLEGKVVPILAGSALQNIGVRKLLDAVCDYLPAPKAARVLAESGTVEPKQDGPLAALVFKTSADPYVGKLTYFRVYAGAVDSNSQVWNSTRNAAERIGQLYMLRGKTQEAVPHVTAGDIGAVAKLNVTGTGDTLCVQASPVKLTPVSFPAPIFAKSVYPKTKADVDKLGAALQRLIEEDPTLRMQRQTDTAETVLYGIGETQLEVAADKLQRKFGVGVNLETPRVPYKETITLPAKAEYKHKKQSGGHGQYGHVLLELEPLPRGTGNEFTERVVGGSVPRNFIPAVEKGVNEGFQEGVVAGFPIVDMRATLYDGSYHPVDSSEICFKIAGAQALKKGMTAGKPILLEPIMNLKVTVPNDLTGDIISDLNTKRARVLGMNPEGDKNVIEAQVPLSEIQRYTIDLKSMTQGRAVYTAEFSHYEAVPAHISEKIISERGAEKAEKAEKA
ncbi:MAG: elongation factor G [Chloroflexi bacterium]|nr:elongation factor G [Chloroflexota bacterium]